MSKTKFDKKAAKQAIEQQAKLEGQTSWSHTLRETVESVVIAFILAFLFRTFEAEAFVIPTGSMAPTLQGRHKDIVCPKCGYEYRTGASQEVDDKTGALREGCYLSKATCPMCRYTVDVGPKSGFPSYSGDRIIVSKFAYDLSNPERWNVVVFKYPEDAKQNYIKRLVGMPNERLRVEHGDVYTAPLESGEFAIERKGKKPSKLRAMLQPVYDNDCVVGELLKAGFPARWQSWAATNEQPWISSDGTRSFEIDGKNPSRAWLRYQHLLPTPMVWDAVENNGRFAQPQPTLIHDFYAYNDGEFFGCRSPSEHPEWVGDLAISCNLEVKNSQGAVTLELVKGGRQFRCTIDLTTGQAKLSIPGLAEYAPTGQTPTKGSGDYDVSFVNVDEQLLLWVNGDVVAFDVPTTYSSPNNYQPNTAAPSPGSEMATDLSPVGIAAEGGAAVKVSHLRVDRDIYYVSKDWDRQGMINVEGVVKIGPDNYFMLGDNSPQSKDSRYWEFVNRSLLIGKALFIYWPHSFGQIEIGSWKIPFPFFPNFGDMGFVR